MAPPVEEKTYKVQNSSKIGFDWNVFLDPEKDQQNYKNPEKYRTKTREEIKK